MEKISNLLLCILLAFSAQGVFASENDSLKLVPLDSVAAKSAASGSVKSATPDTLFTDQVKSDPTPWKVIVSIKDQYVYVYKDGKIVRSMKCSTGTVSHPTPLGTFTLNAEEKFRGKRFFSKKYRSWCYWYVGFIKGSYLFHAVPGNFNGKMSEKGLKMLGQRASHGCIRLLDTDAKWLSQTVPDGTTVLIKNEAHKKNGAAPETIES